MGEDLDSEAFTGDDDRMDAGPNDNLALPHEGHSLMRSFVNIRDPSIRRLIVDLVVEMSGSGAFSRSSGGTGRH
jgi:hypothetical protein